MTIVPLPPTVVITGKLVVIGFSVTNDLVPPGPDNVNCAIKPPGPWLFIIQ